MGNLRKEFTFMSYNIGVKEICTLPQCFDTTGFAQNSVSLYAELLISLYIYIYIYMNIYINTQIKQ